MDSERNSHEHYRPFCENDVSAIDTYLKVLDGTNALKINPADEEEFIIKMKYDGLSIDNLSYNDAINAEKSMKMLFAHEVADKYLRLYFRLRMHRVSEWMDEEVFKRTKDAFRDRLNSFICDLKFQGHEYEEPHVHMLIVVKEIFNDLLEPKKDDLM